MIEGPEQACLAIADVSGYTGYLAGVELDHAQDILADLIGTVVEAMAPFQLAKLEGDAAFAVLSGDRVDGSSLQDVIEGTYFAFRTRLRDIKQASTCECNACIRIPDLDLKLVVHHGTMARQRMLGLEELVGPDVILVHRLLKNKVIEATGIAAYALYTQATLDSGGIDPRRQGLIEHHETTDIAGEVTVWLRDLDAAWQALRLRPRLEIPSERVYQELTMEAPVPPAIAFDYLTSPVRRPTWGKTITGVEEMTSDGRRGVGTTNHCMHGKDVTLERILDWRPPHYWLVSAEVPGVAAAVMYSDELSALPDGGTRIVSRFGSDGTLDRSTFDDVWPHFEGDVMASVANLAAVFEQLAAAGAGVASASVPESRGRHLAEPVRG